MNGLHKNTHVIHISADLPPQITLPPVEAQITGQVEHKYLCRYVLKCLLAQSVIANHELGLEGPVCDPGFAEMAQSGLEAGDSFPPRLSW